MADEFKNEEENNEDDDFGALTGGDSGLGNLPPLSDFDSVDTESSEGLPPSGSDDDSGDDSGGDSGLPPLDNMSDSGGLPPIDDIKVDTPADRDVATPAEAGGLATPTGSEPISTPSFDTPSGGLDTPEPMSGLGFQDFAADSDFSPETPDIGPGPDSDLDTPMFDSAFGGDSGDFGSGGQTQAMDTPMFDAGPDTPTGDEAGGSGVGGGFGDFDTGENLFGGGGGEPQTGGDELGTPIPDFSPDTGVPAEPITGAEEGGKKKKKARASRGGGGPGMLVTAIIAVVALGAGIGIAASGVLPLNSGMQEEVDQLTQDNSRLQSRVRELEDIVNRGETVSPEELEKLIAEIETAREDLRIANEELDGTTAELGEARNTLRTVQGDIEEKNAEFVTVQEQLESLQQNLAITQARHDGLMAENRRLTTQVGGLEQAHARQQASRDTLLHNTDLLLVQIEGGSPLAPQKYAHEKRMNAALDLREKILNSNWVEPELLDEYTQLYLDELAIAASREYFFAKIPVSDELGTQRIQWAECLMNGNWSVYYRTIDGQHVGSFENTSTTITPRYEFRSDLPGDIRSDIESAITAARVADWAEKIAVLEQKQAVYEDRSHRQKTYDAL